MLRCSVISMTLAKGNICSSFIYPFNMPDAVASRKLDFVSEIRGARRCRAVKFPIAGR